MKDDNIFLTCYDTKLDLFASPYVGEMKKCGETSFTKGNNPVLHLSLELTNCQL